MREKTELQDSLRNKIGRISSGSLRFAIASAANIVLLFLLTAGFHELLKWDEVTAYVTAIVLVFGFNFLALRYYVYRESKDETDIRRQLVLTAVSSVGFRLLEILSFTILTRYLAIDYLLTMVIIHPLSFVVKFAVYKWVVFLPNAINRRTD